jgi:putative protease
MEEDTLSVGDEMLIIGPTTGVYEDTVKEIRLEDKPVENVSKGVFCSVKVKELVRRGDQVYRWILVKDEF